MSTINTTSSSLASARHLDLVQEMLTRSLTRLSSGSKAVSPADDSATSAVTAKADSQVRRVQAATTNAQNAVSYTQSADGFLGVMSRMLSRMGELSSLAQDPSKSADDVAVYGTEFQALQDQIRSIVGGTTAEIGGTADLDSPQGVYNGRILFGPDSGLSVTLGSTADSTLSIPASNLRDGAMRAMIAQDSAGAFTLSVTDAGAAAAIDTALGDLGTERAALGAAQSRLGLATASLQVEYENLTAANSRIRDVDVADESTRMAKFNVLVQSGTAMLAQANQTPQSVLKLLQA